MLNEAGSVLYVGKAKNLKKRVTSYTQRERLPNRIQRFLPPFNVLLRDDKSYPYILMTRDHDFPQLMKHRGAKNRKGWYFGPFASAGAVNETVILLQRGFMIRNCSDGFYANRTRPCLQYHIKRCTAPCVQKIAKEDY